MAKMKVQPATAATNSGLPAGVGERHRGLRRAAGKKIGLLHHAAPRAIAPQRAELPALVAALRCEIASVSIEVWIPLGENPALHFCAFRRCLRSAPMQSKNLLPTLSVFAPDGPLQCEQTRVASLT